MEGQEKRKRKERKRKTKLVALKTQYSSMSSSWLGSRSRKQRCYLKLRTTYLLGQKGVWMVFCFVSLDVSFVWLSVLLIGLDWIGIC